MLEIITIIISIAVVLIASIIAWWYENAPEKKNISEMYNKEINGDEEVEEL